MARTLDPSPLTAALERAARRHAEARRREAQSDLSRIELAMLLRRFGLAREPVSDAVAAGDAAGLPEAESASLRARVRGELDLLARLARRRDPRYDINRHMAAMRLARWLEDGRPWHAPETPPGSGCSRNQRFRRAPSRQSGSRPTR
ncbi:hypothetical protein [Aurantimonas marianensis]|uniref:Uncharacterized protein n=1 Tax=Aurantimonas marianensis TaxID=2920428 RepID=A0A9X2H6T4_9HYPH|nr:hypothetical protein [Aurantimonas marianensis]MCP3054868.1 hypothetical protein [Aurantimonas marianensis]